MIKLYYKLIIRSQETGPNLILVVLIDCDVICEVLVSS